MYGPLLRPRYDRKIAGVCAAFARSYGWDITMVRLALVLLAVFGGGGVLAYVICWIVIPEDPAVATPQPYSGAYPPPPPVNYSQSYPQNPPSQNEPPASS